MSESEDNVVNVGVKRIQGYTSENREATATSQLADVTRVSCLVSKMCDEGNTVPTLKKV